MEVRSVRRARTKALAVIAALASGVALTFAVAATANAAPSNTSPANMLYPAIGPSPCDPQSTSITQACINAAVADWNNALAKEGKAPISATTFGSDFGSIGVDQQLLRLTNLDRSLHGFAAIGGINGANHAAVQAAANSGSDANGPSCYCSWGSNFASTLNSLVTEFLWMYDDGPGSPNAAGDWAHRSNILSNYGSPQYMDVAINSSHGTTSMYWGYPVPSGGGGSTGGGSTGGSTGGSLPAAGSGSTTTHRSSSSSTHTTVTTRQKPYLHHRR